MVCGEASWGTVYEMVSRMKPYCESLCVPVRLSVRPSRRGVAGTAWGGRRGGGSSRVVTGRSRKVTPLGRHVGAFHAEDDTAMAVVATWVAARVGGGGWGGILHPARRRRRRRLSRAHRRTPSFVVSSKRTHASFARTASLTARGYARWSFITELIRE